MIFFNFASLPHVPVVVVVVLIRKAILPLERNPKITYFAILQEGNFCVYGKIGEYCKFTKKGLPAISPSASFIYLFNCPSFFHFSFLSTSPPFCRVFSVLCIIFFLPSFILCRFYTQLIIIILCIMAFMDSVQQKLAEFSFVYLELSENATHEYIYI